jgi:hypothetical protein
MTDYCLWTVYEKPSDYPNHYVARKFFYKPTVEPTHEMLKSVSLDILRSMLPKDLHRIPRSETDDPRIVEVWI